MKSYSTFVDRRYAYWEPRVGDRLALKQAHWERRQIICRAREAGMKFNEIAKLFNISDGRANQIWQWRRAHATSPVEKWINHGGEVAAMIAQLKKQGAKDLKARQSVPLWVWA